MKKVDAADALEAVTKAVIAGKSPKKAAVAAGLSNANAENLERAIGVSIDEFREKTKVKLMAMSDKMLKQIDEGMDQIPPSAWTFAYSVIRDSITSMDAKTAPGAANVNIQVNNYGTDAAAKRNLIDTLMGVTPVIEVVSPTPQPQKGGEAK